MTNAEYQRKLLQPLIGAKLVEVRRNVEMECLVLVFRLPQPVHGKIEVEVEVWQDEEGNGPGWLQPVVVSGEDTPRTRKLAEELRCL